MFKFVIPPDRASYSVTDGIEVASTKLDGGAARYRQDVLNSTSRVTVQWTVGPEKYKYIRSFYRAIAYKGAVPFLIDLILDSPDLTEHKAYFIPGTMRLVSQSGLQYVVASELEVYPADINYDDEVSFVALYSEFGENWETEFPISEDLLNTITNVDLPNTMGP